MAALTPYVDHWLELSRGCPMAGHRNSAMDLRSLLGRKREKPRTGLITDLEEAEYFIQNMLSLS